MINLYESELNKILPDFLKADVRVQAFCYAFDNQIKKILDRCKKIEIWSNLNNVDESLLDYLAAELRTQYYEKDLEVSVKRKLIANTLIWYQKAGTVSAVEELITVVFGEGKTEEWYEYNGEPHHFKILTGNPLISSNDLQKFNEIIEKVKRKTAILDAIEIVLTANMNTYYGFSLQTGSKIMLRQEG